MVNRFGKVDDGTTVTDFDEEEVSRKHTLARQSRLRRVEQAQDQPDRHAGLRQLPERHAGRHARLPTPRVVVVDAVSGVEVQTEKVWQAAEELGLPRLVVVNRLDRERASLEPDAATR